MRPEAFAEALPQFLENAPRPLRVDFARHFHRKVVTVVAAAHRSAQRIGVLLGARLPAAGSSVGAGANALLLHRLRQSLGSLAHGIERAALTVHRAVGIALPELAFGLTHGLPGFAELTHFVAFALLPRLAKAALAQLLQQLVQSIFQPLLVLTQIAHLTIALAGLLSPLTIAPAVLTLAEGLVAQLLLLANDVAQFVKRRHHVVVAVIAAGGAGPRRLQVFEHRLQFFKQPSCSILVAGASEVLEPIQHAFEILLAERTRIAVERP